MDIVSLDTWDENFFQKFAEFKNAIHADIPTSFPISVDELAIYFSPNSVFASDWKWHAFQLKHEGQILAQAIICFRKNSTEANLGFIDWKNNKEAAKLLTDTIEAFARSQDLRKIRTPVDLNFFLKYRIRLPGAKGNLYGEPVYPDYYHDLFQHAGYAVIGRWDTYEVKRWAGIVDFLQKRKGLKKKIHQSEKKTKTQIRSIRLKDWDNELRTIHDLFSRAYSKMPEFEPVSFPQFKAIYGDFKYLVNPLYSYIVEMEGVPVGFSINYVDPLPVLAPHKGKKLATWQKALLLLKLRANRGTYMISHIGKVPGPDGEELKGIQIQVSRRITLASFLMRRVVVTFQNENSPSRRSWNPKVWLHHATYVLYGKEL